MKSHPCGKKTIFADSTGAQIHHGLQPEQKQRELPFGRDEKNQPEAEGG
jgi:hypothetical protein